VRTADNLTTFMCRLSWNVGASTSWNPQGLSRPLMVLLYLHFFLDFCIFIFYLFWRNVTIYIYIYIWLRHCATSRKVTGSIPDSVTGIFHWHNPSGRTMALGLTQTLTEMSARSISWG